MLRNGLQDPSTSRANETGVFQEDEVDSSRRRKVRCPLFVVLESKKASSCIMILCKAHVARSSPPGSTHFCQGLGGDHSNAIMHRLSKFYYFRDARRTMTRTRARSEAVVVFRSTIQRAHLGEIFHRFPSFFLYTEQITCNFHFVSLTIPFLQIFRWNGNEIVSFARIGKQSSIGTSDIRTTGNCFRRNRSKNSVAVCKYMYLESRCNTFAVHRLITQLTNLR